jgi:hypothetical protein
MYRYYKGEKENPFDHEKQNSHMFWFYESVFENQFIKWESYQWYDFFGGYTSKKFMEIISGEDYERPAENKKAAIFDLWLNEYLWIDKLYPEYGGENWYRKEYYSNSAQ